MYVRKELRAIGGMSPYETGNAATPAEEQKFLEVVMNADAMIRKQSEGKFDAAWLDEKAEAKRAESDGDQNAANIREDPGSD
ncbi:hypothetical protein ACX3O0_06945 [Homoserinimonas sp. A447]